MTYLLDTSAWIAFARERNTPGARAARDFIGARATELLVCSPVRMELALEPDELRRRRLFKVYDGIARIDIVDDDFDLAASIYRAVRVSGHTIRSLVDCLVAALAVRAGAELVHDDVDFDRIAAVIDSLTVVRLPGAG
jgi:predicted nucleic acid-binding protein